MHRFFIPDCERLGADFSIEGREAHHALQVLRLREGESLTVLNGRGLELRCEVSQTSRQELKVRCVRRQDHAPPPCPITLIQAVPKGKIMDSLVQKATELGVTRIVPLLTERVISQMDSEGAEAKAAKWQQVAVEAIKQCGAPWLPEVATPMNLGNWLKQPNRFDLQLIGCLESGSRHPRLWLEEFIRKEKKLPEQLAIWVGPEGDFSREEYAQIRSAGARPITLGPLVLRVETAATYCLSVLSYELSFPRE